MGQVRRRTFEIDYHVIFYFISEKIKYPTSGITLPGNFSKPQAPNTTKRLSNAAKGG
jgi:hypothetical protein